MLLLAGALLSGEAVQVLGSELLIIFLLMFRSHPVKSFPVIGLSARSLTSCRYCVGCQALDIVALYPLYTESGTRSSFASGAREQ
tara:strand:+ start:571 stop:825 length:255 start_codon:yes stop_codon:yes gene_type:complete